MITRKALRKLGFDDDTEEFYSDGMDIEIGGYSLDLTDYVKGEYKESEFILEVDYGSYPQVNLAITDEEGNLVYYELTNINTDKKLKNLVKLLTTE